MSSRSRHINPRREHGRSTAASSCTSRVTGVGLPAITAQKSQTSIRNFFVAKSRRKKPQSLGTSRPTEHFLQTPNALTTGVSSSATPDAVATTISDHDSSSPYTDSSRDADRIGSTPLTKPSMDGGSIVSQSPASTRVNVAATVTQRKRRRTTPVYEQLYIDLGQRNFAKPTVCSVCGMLAVHGLEADAQRHEAICQAHTLGVSFSYALPRGGGGSLRGTSSGIANAAAGSNSQKPNSALRIRTIFVLPYTKATARSSSIVLATKSRASTFASRNRRQQEAVIIEIRPSDSTAMLQKLTQVRAIVDQELGFVEAKATSPTSKDKLSLTAFLCIVEKRVVGMVLVESITTAFRLLPLSTRQNDYAPLREQTNGTNNHPTSSFAWERATEPCPAVLGIYQLWVHGKHRQCGIASALVDAARTHVVFGYHTVPLHHIAFSSPTESGVQFAMHYHQSYRLRGAEAKTTAIDETEVLVYDCG